MALVGLLLALVAAEPLFERFSSERPNTATGITGTVSAVSADGRSVCIAAGDVVECAVPRWAGNAAVAAVGQAVRAYYVDVPVGPDEDAGTERVWVALYLSS